ncbi:hypothetical protein BC835DRAFT_1416361 [Cytidiella melzeri]|nr:hypothetical protein BC835DRAFT_1416361 [Cytidiella melzeri]
MHASGPSNTKLVRPGVYEIQSAATRLFLNSTEKSVYNGWCDDALTLQKQPNRCGKWKINQVGGGYTIEQVQSGMYCALADAEQFVYQPVVLSSVPTVWTVEYVDNAIDKVRIIWSVSDMCWENARKNAETTLVMGKHDSELEEKPKDTFVWRLKPVGEANSTGRLEPGLYSLQNKASRTYVMMAPDEKTIGCWPESDFKSSNTRLWEITPLGDGYAIRLHGTDKYCTLEENMSSVNVLDKFPAAWNIVPNHCALHSGEGYFQVYWGTTKLTWDLPSNGKCAPGTPISLQKHSSYVECRLFKFTPA